jgi:hypothetical protein
MRNRFGPLALSLLAIGFCAEAQGSNAPLQLPADHPSNGVLELSVAQTLAPDPPRPDIVPRPDHIWRGLIDVSIRNVSPFMIRLAEAALTYEFTVLDSSGRPAAMTDSGKALASEHLGARTGHPPLFSGPVSTFDLRSGETRTSGFRLLPLYELQVGEDYTIQVKYSHEMPLSDGAGKPITERELTYTIHAKSGLMSR